MQTLTSGQRSPLQKLGLDPSRSLTIGGAVQSEADLALFGLSEGKMRDEWMIFYNQPLAPGGWAKLESAAAGNSSFKIELSQVPGEISELVLCASSEAALGGRRVDCRLQQEGSELSFDAGSSLTTQKAAKLLRLYRHPATPQGEWRLEAVGQGFDGGLDALVRHFGGEVAESETASTPTRTAPTAPKPEPISPPEPAKTPVNLSKLDLRKKEVEQVSSQLGISGIQVRLMVVMDASGSMHDEFNSGKVQETVERLVPIASKMDSDGAIEFLWYASEWADGGTVAEENMEGFVGRKMPQHRPREASPRSEAPKQSFLQRLASSGNAKNREDNPKTVQDIGFENEEPKVMQEVIRRHREEPSELPTVVLFITDGGISYNNSRDIERLISESAREDIFWQYVGLGRADYGVLERLDTLRGRELDNAGFFALDDISKINDQELYRRLLSELPLWLEAIRKRRQQKKGAGPEASNNSNQKVSLKKGASLKLAKSRELKVKLSWDGRSEEFGQSDLDLYAFYVTRDGRTGKVYYRDKGSQSQHPYITLDGDSKNAGSETLTIWKPEELSAMVFAAYSAVENGTGSFASYRPSITVIDERGNETTAPVTGNNHFSYWVALARVDIDREGSYTVAQLERYSRAGTEKSPLLRRDGQLQMNSGPVEFKGR